MKIEHAYEHVGVKYSSLEPGDLFCLDDDRDTVYLKSEGLFVNLRTGMFFGNPAIRDPKVIPLEGKLIVSAKQEEKDED